MNATLETVQPDIFYKLASEASLAAVTIFLVREQDILSTLESALGGLGVVAAASASHLPASACRPGTGVGATIEVLMPAINAQENPSAPGPLTDLEMRIRVQENHVINFGLGGTLMSAETIAQMILQTLHQWGSQTSIGLYPAGQPVVPNHDFLPNVSYDVVMRSVFGMTPLLAASTVTFAENNPLQVTLACNTAGAAIYYTIDSSFPGSANAAALLYAAPFNVPANTTVRAAAYAAGLVGSSVTAVLITA